MQLITHSRVLRALQIHGRSLIGFYVRYGCREIYSLIVIAPYLMAGR